MDFWFIYHNTSHLYHTDILCETMCAWKHHFQNFSSLRLMSLLMLSIITQTGLWRIFSLSGELGQDLVSEISTWSFITWAGIWKDHWFAHAVGWHWPEASDHWLGSAGLIIYPLAYCLRCTEFLPSIPPEHTALPFLGFYNEEARQRRILPSTNMQPPSHLVQWQLKHKAFIS